MSSSDKVAPLIDMAVPVAAAAGSVSPVAEAEPGVPQLGLSAEVTPAAPNKGVRLCCAVDGTASMTEMLDAVKDVACATIQEQQNHPALAGWDFEFSVVAFNDWDTAQYKKGTYTGSVKDCPTLTWCPFTKDVDQVKSQIRNIVAHGGADMPEDVASALKLLVECLDWSDAASKIVIFATDACGHGFTNGSDNFPNGDPAGETKASTLATVRRLADMGIDFTFINMCPANSEPMRLAFKQVYEEALAANPNAGTFVTQDMLPAQPTHHDMRAAAGHAHREYDMDRSLGDGYDEMPPPPSCLPSLAATPSATTMSRAISDSTSATIYHRTGLTPMTDYDSMPVLPVAPVASLDGVPEDADLPPLVASVSGKVADSDLP